MQTLNASTTKCNEALANHVDVPPSTARTPRRHAQQTQSEQFIDEVEVVINALPPSSRRYVMRLSLVMARPVNEQSSITDKMRQPGRSPRLAMISRMRSLFAVSLRRFLMYSTRSLPRPRCGRREHESIAGTGRRTAARSLTSHSREHARASRPPSRGSRSESFTGSRRGRSRREHRRSCRRDDRSG